MKTITIRLENDSDSKLLLSLLETAKFEGDVEAWENDDDFSDEEVKIFNERIEKHEKDPSSAMGVEEVKDLLKRKYNL